jgi:hypothetical protein
MQYNALAGRALLRLFMARYPKAVTTTAAARKPPTSIARTIHKMAGTSRKAVTTTTAARKPPTSIARTIHKMAVTSRSVLIASTRSTESLRSRGRRWRRGRIDRLGGNRIGPMRHTPTLHSANLAENHASVTLI